MRKECTQESFSPSSPRCCYSPPSHPWRAELTPANVAGTWNFKVEGDTGTAEQVIVFTQDGDKLTGTFKGPKQSGSIAGTMDGPRIKFRVAARFPINYIGTVTGETMSGTLTAQGKTGNFYSSPREAGLILSAKNHRHLGGRR